MDANERESGYNPDVLSCLANLSSDEVFTPPQLANNMLDLLPTDLWSDSNATFLDPACKSGVFLLYGAPGSSIATLYDSQPPRSLPRNAPASLKRTGRKPVLTLLVTEN